MSKGLSRDALIERVAGIIDDQYDDYSPQYNAAGVCVSSGLADAAVDAVLRAVADDLDAMYCDAGVSVREENNGDMYGEDLAYLDGVEAAARRVRRLLGAIVQYAPLPIHRTEAGYPNCATCDGGGCPDCTDPA